jgi:hypothetical protein
MKHTLLIGWLLCGLALNLSWAVNAPLSLINKSATHSTGAVVGLALQITPASSTYAVGQSLTVVVTGGQEGTTYALSGLENSAANTPMTSVTIVNAEGTNNTVTWQNGQTQAVFLVSFLAGSEGTGRLLKLADTDPNGTDMTTSGELTIIPRPVLTLSPDLSTYSVGQSLTATMTGGIAGRDYLIKVYSSLPPDLDNDVSGDITPFTSQNTVNYITWQNGQTPQFYIRLDKNSMGSNRYFVVTDLGFTHVGFSSPFTIISCPITVSVSASPSAAVPPGGSVTLTASGATSYTWSNGTTENPLVLSGVNSATTLSVTGVVGLCSATASIGLTLCGVTATLGSSNSVVCQGSNVMVSSTVGVGATGYQWYRDGQSLGASQRGPTLLLGNVQPGDQGSYVLVVTGCKSATSTAFSLQVKPAPVVETVTQGDLVLATGGVLYEFMQVQDRLSTGYEIRQVETNTTGIFRPLKPGPYTVKVTGSNGCQSVSQGSR